MEMYGIKYSGQQFIGFGEQKDLRADIVEHVGKDSSGEVEFVNINSKFMIERIQRWKKRNPENNLVLVFDVSDLWGLE